MAGLAAARLQRQVLSLETDQTVAAVVGVKIALAQ